MMDDKWREASMEQAQIDSAYAVGHAAGVRAGREQMRALLREWLAWYLDEWRGHDTPFVSLIKRSEAALAEQP